MFTPDIFGVIMKGLEHWVFIIGIKISPCVFIYFAWWQYIEIPVHEAQILRHAIFLQPKVGARLSIWSKSWIGAIC